MLGINPTVDFVFKKIFGSPENASILVGLLNAVLQTAVPVVDVEILNPFNYQDFKDDKQIILDIRARDSNGRWFNIEMQVAVGAGLLKRLVYYVSSLYSGQLKSGENYVTLQPAVSICFLNSILFSESEVSHHRLRLADPENGVEISDAIEVHTIELTKYNLNVETIASASTIEQWVFFLLFADQNEASRLRELLPAVEIQQAITVLETIAAKTEDRVMYDERQKAILDRQWLIDGAREEAHEQGLEQGREEGRKAGRVEGRVEGREEGLEQGLVAGKIQALQELLGDEPTSTVAMLEYSASELEKMHADLQQRLRNRMDS